MTLVRSQSQQNDEGWASAAFGELVSREARPNVATSHKACSTVRTNVKLHNLLSPSATPSVDTMCTGFHHWPPILKTNQLSAIGNLPIVDRQTLFAISCTSTPLNMNVKKNLCPLSAPL